MSDSFDLFGSTFRAMALGAVLGAQRDSERAEERARIIQRNEASQSAIRMLDKWEAYAFDINQELSRVREALEERNQALAVAEEQRKEDLQGLAILNGMTSKLLRATNVQTANVAALQAVAGRLIEILRTQGGDHLDMGELQRLFDMEFNNFYKGTIVCTSDEDVRVHVDSDLGSGSSSALEKASLETPIPRPRPPQG